MCIRDSIRTVLQKKGGRLGESGSTTHMFLNCGIIHVGKDKIKEEEILEIAINSGAKDCIILKDIFEIITEKEDFYKVKTELEKNLLKKINELRKYFSSINKDENFEQSLANLAESKKVVFDFFDNVIVNEDDLVIKKNRLELIQMMCKTFENYINFYLIKYN